MDSSAVGHVNLAKNDADIRQNQNGNSVDPDIRDCSYEHLIWFYTVCKVICAKFNKENSAHVNKNLRHIYVESLMD